MEVEVDDAVDQDSRNACHGAEGSGADKAARIFEFLKPFPVKRDAHPDYQHNKQKACLWDKVEVIVVAIIIIGRYPWWLILGKYGRECARPAAQNRIVPDHIQYTPPYNHPLGKIWCLVHFRQGPYLFHHRCAGQDDECRKYRTYYGGDEKYFPFKIYAYQERDGHKWKAYQHADPPAPA